MIAPKDDARSQGRRSRSALLAIALLLAAGCGTLDVNRLTSRIIPSNERDWSPQFRKLPRAVIVDDQITLYNIRNNVYLAEKDFLIQHYDRVFSLSDIQSVDFLVVPFQGLESIAHTMLSFGLADGTYIAVSVEVRTEIGESYTTAMGLSNEFELTYVVADERDVIRLRTRHRDAEVYLYPSTATPEQAQLLFVDIMERVNQLAEKPEFYDTITNNCTNNLVRHVNRVLPNRVPRAWQILLSGHSDRYAYDLGLLDQRIPFDRLKALARINDLAETHYDAEDFSRLIRSRVNRLEEHFEDGELLDGPSTEQRRPWVGQLMDSLRTGSGVSQRRPGRGLRTANRADEDPIEVKIEE